MTSAKANTGSELAKKKPAANKTAARKEMVSFRISPKEKSNIAEEARQGKSTISDVARDRFRSNMTMRELHLRMDRIEEMIMEFGEKVRSAENRLIAEYQGLVNQDLLAQKLVDTIESLGPDFVADVMRRGVQEFYRTRNESKSQ